MSTPDADPRSIESWRERFLPIVVILLLPAPVLFLPYLPMTDFPQHLAVVAIMDGVDNPQLGFAEYYQVDVGRTLYLSPYLLGLALAKVLPVEVAVRCVFYLSIVLFPLGLLAMLRAMGKPAWLGLLALPLTFHHYVMWGFVAFNLSLGLALLACALLMRPTRSVGTDLCVAALCAAVSITHLFGIAVVLGFGCLWLVVGERRELFRRLPSLTPAVIGAVGWFWNMSGRPLQPALDSISFPVWVRALMTAEFVNGGFWLSLLLLMAYLAMVGRLLWGSLPRSRARWEQLTHFERVIYLYIGLNLALYFFLPNSFGGQIQNVFCRHALLAVAFLPLVVPRGRVVAPGRRLRVALTALAVVVFLSHWISLFAFDQEARGFDAVVDNLPPKPKLLALIYDKSGKYLRTHPYLHFSCYAQVRRGGIVSYSFARHLHHMPVFEHQDSPAPPSPPKQEWRPSAYRYADFGDFYDYVLVRAATGERPPLEETKAGQTVLLRTLDNQNDVVTRVFGAELRNKVMSQINFETEFGPPEPFPFELIYHDDNWWLYRAALPAE